MSYFSHCTWKTLLPMSESEALALGGSPELMSKMSSVGNWGILGGVVTDPRQALGSVS